MIRILVLYAEIMPYNVSNYIYMNKLVTEDLQVDVFHYGPSKKLTKYKIPDIPNFNFYYEEEFPLNKLKSFVSGKNYNVVYVCGRVEQKYLKLALSLKDSSVIIGSTDEQFKRNFKQRIVKYFSYLLYRRYFSYMMIPGTSQLEYMRYLGFEGSQLFLGSYSCDVDVKNALYKEQGRKFPDQFKLLYVGRFEKIKGLIELLSVIDDLRVEGIDIKIKMIGNGTLKKHILKYDFVELFDFSSHERIFDLTRDISYFILPSKKEPWGVVVHEFAALGLPLILSNKVGASSQFLNENMNGYSFESNNRNSLKSALVKAVKTSEIEWNKQSVFSLKLSRGINEKMWGENILNIIKSIKCENN